MSLYTGKNAIALVRVSSRQQADRGISLPAQTENIVQFAQSHNIHIVDTVAEEGKSAYRLFKNRREFNGMLEYIKNTNMPFLQRKADPYISFILVEDESRFFRNRYKAMQTKRELKKYGVVVIPVLSPPPQDDIARLWQESIFETQAEASSRDNSKKTESKMIRSCHQRWEGSRSPENNNLGWAFHNGGRVIYGYKRHEVDMGRDDNGRRRFRTIWLKNDETELNRPIWQWLRKILVEYRLKDRLSYDKIRDRLNRIGLKAPSIANGHRPRDNQSRPELWSDSSVRQICNNILYTGVYYWNRRDYKDYKREEGKIKRKNECDIQLVEKAHPAIITREEYKKLMALNRERDPRTTPSRSPLSSRWLLTFCFYCKHCGAKMMGRDRWYVCSSRFRKGKASCNNSMGFSKEWVEDTLIDMILNKYANKDRIKKLTAQIQKQIEEQYGDASGMKKSLEDELTSLNKEIKNLILNLESGIASQLLKESIMEKESKRGQIQASLQNLLPKKISVSIKEIEDRLIDYRKTFRQGMPEEKREILKLLIDRIEADFQNRSLEIHLKRHVTDGYSPTGNRTPIVSLKS